jgi:hypothetical protein
MPQVGTAPVRGWVYCVVVLDAWSRRVVGSPPRARLPQPVSYEQSTTRRLFTVRPNQCERHFHEEQKSVQSRYAVWSQRVGGLG